jgi:hypothetical protein
VPPTPTAGRQPEATTASRSRAVVSKSRGTSGSLMLRGCGSHTCSDLAGHVPSRRLRQRRSKVEELPLNQPGLSRRITPELTDAGGQWRPRWKLTRPARVRSSDFVGPRVFHPSISYRDWRFLA